MKSKLHRNGDDKVNVLGVDVASTNLQEVLNLIEQKIALGTKETSSRPFFIITVYSESLMHADPGFKSALAQADLIVADGVSIMAAMDYLADGKNGLQIGLKIISGKYPERPTGVKMFKSILESGKYRVYLTGGWNAVAERLAERYKNVVGWDNGDKNITKINAAKPDILFVSLGRFKQEVWIAQNLDKLRSKVVIGVGSAFDEVGDNWPVPKWVETYGLKWLWRVTRDPKHIVRAFNAFPIFPLKVFLWKHRRGQPR